ncbi:MAG: 3-phosphoshikimate 1-carboxyvinyltransferase, partial [Acidimicrobiales bacterium]
MSDLSDLSKLADPFPVEPVEGPLDAVVTVPGSKSITNRALICAALADGTSVLSGALSADDTHAMVGVLAALGLDVAAEQDGTVLTVVGCGGSPPPCDATIDVRQSGTTARFVIPMLALGRGSYRVTAHPQMQARPMDTTFSALETLGGAFEPIGDAGHLPATIRGGGLRSGAVRVRGDASSQFLSGMLMIGPCLPDGLVVEVTSALVSQPYVELTVAVMKAFGAVVERPDPQT